MSDYRMHLAGAWCEAASGVSRDVVNPAEGEPFGVGKIGVRRVPGD